MEEGSRIPLVRFGLGGDDGFVALLDTGSESTLFDQNLGENENLTVTPTDYKMSLIGLSGETEERRVMDVDADMVFTDTFGCGHTVNANGIISDLSGVSENIRERYGKHLSVSVVLGSDFLKANGAKIDYRKRRLILR